VARSGTSELADHIATVTVVSTPRAVRYVFRDEGYFTIVPPTPQGKREGFCCWGNTPRPPAGWLRPLHPHVRPPNTELVRDERSVSGEWYNTPAQQLRQPLLLRLLSRAISALMREGIMPPGSQWGHDFVQAQFVGQLINRNKRYPAELRDVLERLYDLRQIADYRSARVSATVATRALRRAREVVPHEQQASPRP